MCCGGKLGSWQPLNSDVLGWDCQGCGEDNENLEKEREKIEDVAGMESGE